MLLELFERACRHLPARCAICGCWPAQTLCTDCLARFASPRPRCRTCALPVLPGQRLCAPCSSGNPVLDCCHAVVDYAYPWNTLISRYKFGPDPSWAPVLAGMMLALPQTEVALARADHVIAIPLPPHRLGERGFNQAYELARRLHPAKARCDLLTRQLETPAQSSLGRAARWRNLTQAMTVPPERAHLVATRRLLLIDDVMTTGATLNAAASALRAAGALRVEALVLARTP